jgi:hypothetical protein
MLQSVQQYDPHNERSHYQSITMRCPFSSKGIRQVSRQSSKTVRLQAPTTVKGKQLIRHFL